MRFQPGEPGLTAKSLDVLERLLVYCSGNSLIICENEQLVQTTYLPSDGLAVSIDRPTAKIAVLVTDKILILEPQESYTKGRSWTLAKSLDCKDVAIVQWFDGCLLLGGSKLELRRLDNSSEWIEPSCGAFDLSISPNTRHFVSLSESTHLKLWTRVSSSALAFDVDYLRLPSAPKWTKWRGKCLFVWCCDSVLRAYRPLKSGRYELFANIALECAPAIIRIDDLVYLIELGASQCSLLSLDLTQGIVRPVRAWRVPLELRDFSFSDAVMVYAHVDGSNLRFACHKKGLVMLAYTPNFLDSTPQTVKAFIGAIFSGHTKSIKSISRGSMGDALFTTSRFEENIVWKAFKLASGETTLRKKCLVTASAVDQSDLSGSQLLTLSGKLLQLWGTSAAEARLTARKELEKAPLRVGFAHSYVLAVYDDSVQLLDVGLEVQNTFELQGTIAAVMVDPVGWNEEHRDIFSTISATHIKSWALQTSGSLKWTETCALDIALLGREPITKVQMSSRRKLALALGNRLVVWSACTNLIEFDQTGDPIADLDWTTAPTGECLLGVGYTNHVLIYCQMRYDYTRKLEAWKAIREISIEKYTTHKIGDSIWLKDGTFVIGAGNQLFIQDSQVDVKDEAVRKMLLDHNTISSLEQSSTLFDINAVLNGPLPIYHPQFLIQLIYSGRLNIAREILCRLLKALKYTAVTDSFAELDRYLDCELCDMGDIASSNPLETNFNAQVARELEEQLQKKAVSYITRHQQVTLLSVVQSVAQIDLSLDTSATLYMLGFHLFRIHADQTSMNMRDFVWASVSNTKQPLLDEVEQAGATAKLVNFLNYGLPFWLDQHILAEKAELLAKRVFAVTRDPVQVTLIYLALRKKPLLIGLWRVTSSHPEQAKTMKLLNNDFTTPRWKAAALKNAYALMSRHRYEYAAAFFLLGDSVKDACNVLAKQMENLPLAFMVARLYDGDSGEAMRYLIDRFLVQEAPENPFSHHLWLQVWAYLTIGDNKAAVKAATVARTSQAQRTITDPVLMWMYAHLRGKYALSPGEEMKALQNTSRTYCRMGCDLVALVMCRDWKFNTELGITPAVSVKPSEPASPASSGIATPQTFETPADTPDSAATTPATTPATMLSAADPAEFDPSAFGW